MLDELMNDKTDTRPLENKIFTNILDLIFDADLANTSLMATELRSSLEVYKL